MRLICKQQNNSKFLSLFVYSDVCMSERKKEARSKFNERQQIYLRSLNNMRLFVYFIIIYLVNVLCHERQEKKIALHSRTMCDLITLDTVVAGHVFVSGKCFVVQTYCYCKINDNNIII